jgi:hypothetical protein
MTDMELDVLYEYFADKPGRDANLGDSMSGGAYDSDLDDEFGVDGENDGHV